MKELLALSTHQKDLTLVEEGALGPLLEEFSLAGVELLPLKEVPEGIRPFVCGVHLPFQPVWLPFWLEDRRYLREVFPGETNLARFFGGERPEDFLNLLKGWFERALSLKPAYLVFHVSHCGLEEVFSLRFRYDKKTVLQAVAEVLNAALEGFPAQRSLLLFENLWWPGLTLLEDWEAEYFWDRLRVPFPTGLLLDTGHLLNASYLLRQPSMFRGPVYPAQALSLLFEVLSKKPPSLRELIKGVHLNFSPRADLFFSDEEGKRRCLAASDPLFRFRLARERVLSLDPHFPFYGVDLRPFLDLLAPDFLVHELRFSSLADLRPKLRLQKECFSDHGS